MASIFGSSKDEQRALTNGELTQQQQQKTTAVSSEIPTGIPGFDDLLGQGLPVGNLYLLSGSFSSNSSLFAQQVLYNTMLRKAGKVAYYTVEKASTDIADDMAVYGMNVEKYVDDGSWIFARLIPPNLKKISEALPEAPMEQKIELTSSLTPLMDHFLSAAKEGRSTVVHLTPLTRVFGIDEIQSTLLYMTAVARKYGGIHFVLMTDGIAEQHTAMAVKDLVDAVYEMNTEARGSDMETIVTVQKMRKVLPRTRLIRLTIRKDGFATETIRRVG